MSGQDWLRPSDDAKGWDEIRTDESVAEALARLRAEQPEPDFRAQVQQEPRGADGKASAGLPGADNEPDSNPEKSWVFRESMENLPASGKFPGVGWVLSWGARTSRNVLIQTTAHPLGTASYAEAANPIKYPPHTLTMRWPDYGRGYDGPHPPAVQEEILRALFRAGRIPGLSESAYGLYSGEPTAEQIIDLYALNDSHPHKVAIMRAWAEISAPPVVDPKPDPKPGPGPVTPPVVPPTPAGGLRPLSPAAVRVKELRSLLDAPRENPFAEAVCEALYWLPDVLAVEAIRGYRLLRAAVEKYVYGSTRPIPPEDRP